MTQQPMRRAAKAKTPAPRATPRHPAANLELPTAEQSATVHKLNRQQPGRSLLASAQRLTSGRIVRPQTEAREWQRDAWEMFNLVGEERFLASTLAGRLAQARLFVARVADDPTQPPEQVEAGEPVEVFSAWAKDNRPQVLNRMAVNLFMAGECWLAGIPRYLLDAVDEIDTNQTLTTTTDPIPDPPLDSVDINDLEWRTLSVTEVSTTRDGGVVIKLGPGREDVLTLDPDDLFLVRVWRPHPQHWWEADSPARSSLPVLHELVALTMQISAQIDSRLAGAGLLLVPSSAARSIRVAISGEPDDESDPFTDALMEAMLTPIKDRASASAVVPLVSTVPDESIEHFRHISFSTPLDAQAQVLREEAIRRLALGQDAPPELLLGTEGMNHWGAWLVREDVVTTHLEPPLALICDAITSQYLQPTLVQQGMTEEEAGRYVVWYDVAHLITRPNRFTDASALYRDGVISAQTYREAGNFGEGEAPEEERLPLPRRMALDLVQQSPSLLVSPGLSVLVAQMTALMEGGEIPGLPLDERNDLDNKRAAQEQAAKPEDTGPADGGLPAPEDTGGGAAGPGSGESSGPSVEGESPAVDAGPTP